MRALNNKVAEVRADMERDIGRLNDEHQQLKTDLNSIKGRQDSTDEECNELRARMAENRQKMAEVISFDMTTDTVSPCLSAGL